MLIDCAGERYDGNTSSMLDLLHGSEVLSEQGCLHKHPSYVEDSFFDGVVAVLPPVITKAIGARKSALFNSKR